MKIFVVTCKGIPACFYKETTLEEALKKFKSGNWNISRDDIINHPSFQCRELTMGLLLELAPKEFALSPYTDF